MPDTWGFYAFYSVILLIPMVWYIRRQLHREKQVREAAAKGQVFTEAPLGFHPQIDVSHCIGCQGCTSVCPEGQVLGMVGGKAAVVRPWRCIGHSLCSEACPVGAIRMVRAAPGINARLPFLTEEFETSVPNLYIAGELGGLALIRNAVQQGAECIDVIAARLAAAPDRGAAAITDVIIAGAGPAGISAGLRALELGLSFLVLERDEVGGTITKYPRQKLVMTTTFSFPLYPPEKKRQLSKEYIVDFFRTVTARPDFSIRAHEEVKNIHANPDGTLTVSTGTSHYQCRAVILAMGRAGSPNKLGIPGEELAKVMYRLIEADHYTNRRILVVGGGDSAVEAAMGLAMQPGNKVTLSYRRSEFARIKERNAQRLESEIRARRIEVLFNSAPVAITQDTVSIQTPEGILELPNDYVWVFAGGAAPDDFLKKIGIHYGPRDLTRETVLS